VWLLSRKLTVWLLPRRLNVLPLLLRPNVWLLSPCCPEFAAAPTVVGCLRPRMSLFWC
jgi:hypothetical protein